jgi:RHS repeat-associated protein
LRATNFAYNGPLPEQDLTTTLQYEPRGYITNITEQFTGTNTAPAVSVQHSYDVYGQLAFESVNGSFVYSNTETWDAAGRRTMLSFEGGAGYGFGWQADGNLIAANDSTGGGAYSYNTAGLLTSRTVGNRQTSIASRDGEGRPLAINTTINSVTQLTEANVWSGDGLLLSHTLWRGDFGTDNRAYAYANASRRLTQEQLNVNAATTWTNTFAYDGGAASGPGVLTSAGQAGASIPQWSGFAGSFSRVSSSTNSMISLSAYGHTTGLVTLNAWLDNQPVAVTGIGNGTNAMQWRAPLQLASGTHQLTVSAQMLDGLYTTWATNTFTNIASYQAATDTYDAAGNITNRVWLNPSGGVDRTQTLSWDARGRLHAVTERDASNSGYNWSATYDGLNRRLSTTSVLVTNGVAFNSAPTTINSYYDPQVEFLELGVSYGTTTEFKLYGPDLNGVYGGLNGIGGLDAVSPILNLFEPTLSDERGNILGVITNGVMSWNPARPTGYGYVPNYQPLPLANGADISLASAWRGRWADITGFYSIGLRPYDPISGRWLTFDSVWNEIDASGMTFCGGDPINRVDHDGRLSSLGNDNGVQNLYFGTVPVMQSSIQTTTTLQDGTQFITGQGLSPQMYDPQQVINNSYSIINQPTGQSAFYISQNSVPGTYGDTTITPIPATQILQMQQNQMDDAVIGGVLAAATLAIPGGEVEAPGLLSAEGGMTTGFRAVSDTELQQITQDGEFFSPAGSSTPTGNLGKFFYTDQGAAQQAASAFSQNEGIGYSVIQAQVPASSITRTFTGIDSQWIPGGANAFFSEYPGLYNAVITHP